MAQRRRQPARAPPAGEAGEQPKARAEAGPGAPRPTVADAWRSIKADDFLTVHQTPCSRQGFLAGIGGGAAVGALRFALGAPVPRAANWAVGSAVAAAVAQYEFCQWRRRCERDKIKRVVEVYDRKQAEARQGEEEARRRKEREGEARERERERTEGMERRWYKFW